MYVTIRNIYKEVVAFPMQSPNYRLVHIYTPRSVRSEYIEKGYQDVQLSFKIFPEKSLLIQKVDRCTGASRLVPFRSGVVSWALQIQVSEDNMKCVFKLRKSWEKSSQRIDFMPKRFNAIRVHIEVEKRYSLQNWGRHTYTFEITDFKSLKFICFVCQMRIY